ncbi:MAG: hypothetical protein CMG71_00930 [Candidatus Marinimicrobia bacterium]|nr:hypothetical protein [Candidatus Neomarinimicrobiota bacterium]|tara:strand:+ start:55456 stop:56196 length:741 start_codon:yes stop_codon:yes gene_type:complete
MGVLCIIPARGDSKGIKKKNLQKIGDFTLIERALFTAIGCNFIERIIVSTDSNEIIDLANHYGNYAPFRRPDKLATDEAGSLGVIQHALAWAEKEDSKIYDKIVLLEPPSPFRLPKHVQEALKISIKSNATSVMSVVEVGDYHPIRMKKMNDDGALKGILMQEPDGFRRQDQEAVYIRNCAVYVFSRKTIISDHLWGDSPYGYLMSRSLYGINIDEPIDLVTAKAFYSDIKKKKKELKNIEYIPFN